MKSKIFGIIVFISSIMIFAQPRIQYTINRKWKFKRSDVERGYKKNLKDSDWQRVGIPHTWNAHDILDDKPGYFRGVVWYRKELNISKKFKDKTIYIYFEGAYQDAKVFVNGSKVGEHKGGYTAFCCNITDFVKFEKENLLAVRLSNRHNKNVPPIGGDLCHFGGIYRDVSIIALNKTHFDIDYFASSGVFITTPEVSAKSARINIKTHIVGPKQQNLRITHQIFNPGGKPVSELNKRIVIEGDKKSIIAQSTTLQNPELWSPARPNLYQVKSRIYDNDGKLLDAVSNPLGFRKLTVDEDEGIILNGEPIFIKGIGTHQDYNKIGYAIPNEIYRNDIIKIEKMGANLVRAHYPLSPIAYDACDELGIMVWAKIPVMDAISHSVEFLQNSKTMMRELMYQNFNSPSFIIWGYACEIFGDMDWYWPSPKSPEKVQENIEETEDFAIELEKLIRETDHFRLTANDFHTDPTPEYYKQANLTDLHMINAWNIYQGWYHNNLDSIGWALQTFRDYNPNVPFLIAEYGAGSDPRIHSYQPTIFDFSIEYQNRFHERYLIETEKYDFVHGMCPWTLHDFQVESRQDAIPHVNSKGLLRTDRTPKDAYFLYQAYWSDEPMVHIASRDWIERKEIVPGKTALRPITVYSNQPVVELRHNGNSLGKKNLNNHKAIWDVPFIDGKNQLEAITHGKQGNLRNFLEIDFTFIPEKLKNEGLPENKLCINVGQSRTYLIDELRENIWVPDKKYKTGNFGHKNGEYYTSWDNMPAWDGIRQGIDQNVKDTELDPVLQTFLVGVTDYKIDVPKGEYSISLYFAEPFTEEERKDPKNPTSANASSGERIFNVLINQKQLETELNLSQNYGVRTAFRKTYSIHNENNEGIHIKLQPIQGQPVLNGIKVIKK